MIIKAECINSVSGLIKMNPKSGLKQGKIGQYINIFFLFSNISWENKSDTFYA